MWAQVFTVTDAILHLDWCSLDAARYAVKHWHYSRSMPTPPVVKVGVWEGGSFIGAVLFSRGAASHLGAPYGLGTTEVCELTRVALGPHRAPVSRVVAIAIKLLRRLSPGLRLIVSFADPNHNHVGAIYQAGNWIYSGLTEAGYKYRDQSGRVWHSRQVTTSGLSAQYGQMRKTARRSACQKIKELPKHRYLMPLDDEMRARLAALSRPYPKKPCAAAA